MRTHLHRPAESHRVLACDGEPQILRALQIVLRDAGLEVATAASAAETLNSASVRPPDAAILDLVPRDRDGVEVVRSIREWRDLPILLLSAVAEEAEKVRAFEAGSDDCLTKPFGPHELVARLHAHGGDAALLRAHVANLRHKIEPEPAKPRYPTTDPRLGYRFAAERTAMP